MGTIWHTVGMYFFLIMVGSLLSAVGTVPYIIETIKGTAKPRVVTWLTWALLTAVAGSAALADQQWGAALFALMGAAATGTVVIVGLRYGDRTYGRLDLACMTMVVVGLLLWQWLQQPAIAVWVAIAVDFIGLVPTLVHAWSSPHEETARTFVLVGCGGILTTAAIVAQGGVSVISLGYPLYVALSMTVCAGIIYWRRTKSQTVEKSPQ